MSSGPPQGGTFSLFPRPPSRNQMNNAPGRPSVDSTARDSPSRTGRNAPLERKMSVREGKKPAVAMTGSFETINPNNAPPSASGTRPLPPTAAEPTIQRPAPVAIIEAPPRCGTAFSEAQTLVRENSARSSRSAAKRAAPNGGERQTDRDGDGEGAAAPPLRSIFPEYNPSLSLAQQNYYPTQTSPTHIPAAAISRRLYSPTFDVPPEQDHHDDINNISHRSPVIGSPPLRSPRSAGTTRTQQQHATATTTTNAATRKWPPPRVDELRPATPETSTTEELRGLWKAANGWRATGGEGRVYTLGVSCERDAPVYTLASRTQQPFYRMKLDPTSSSSAYVALSRFDPARPYKPPLPPKDGEHDTTAAAAPPPPPTKGWQEVLATTLEKAERRHAPSDGLVALLFPAVAARMMAREAMYAAAAERECARLVWDDDSGNHFLVHPALALPFCVTVERNPTWSRTEYTLEHVESSRHLARLTKDGTGTGWVEIDTGIAAKIDAVYLVDVAIAALVLVAHLDGELNRVEVFEPPPSVLGGGAEGRNSRQERRLSSRISKLSLRTGSGDKKKVGRSRLEEFEIDLESQASDLKKHSASKKDKDGTPGCARMLISMLSITFKCLIWCATVAFKALAGLVALVAKCVTSEKL